MATMKINEWTRDHFLSNESSCKMILENSGALCDIPSLNSTPLDYFKDGQLVRFRGMIQDMYNPEYFLSNYEVINTRTGESSSRSGMYVDSALCSPYENISMDSERNVNSERQTFFVISVPGLNEWAKEKEPSTYVSNVAKNISKRSLETSDEEIMDCSEPIRKKEKVAEPCEKTPENSDNKTNMPITVSKDHILNFPIPNEDGKACIVKVYEDTGSKLNEVVDFIGFLSLDPLYASIHDSEKYIDDIEAQTLYPPTSMIPRLHAVKIVSLKKNEIINDPQIVSKAECIRRDLEVVLTHILFGDKLAAEYLICHLISSIYLRKDNFCLGTFPLNIMKFPFQKYKNFPKELYKLLAQLVPKSHYVKLTVDCINDLKFIPKKDYQCNRLTSGILQLSENTHLIIDETELSSGQVSSSGKKNYDAINNLVQFQKVPYDFQFYSVDYETDIPILIISEVKSFIPCVTQIPIQVDEQTENLYPQVVEKVEYYLRDEDRLNNMRQYLNTLRHVKFEFDDQMTKTIQEDFVKMRQENKSFTGDNLHTLMVFSRLMALSYAKNTLTIESWKRALEIEEERWSRLSKRNNSL